MTHVVEKPLIRDKEWRLLPSE